jgi:hypothetical protein
MAEMPTSLKALASRFPERAHLIEEMSIHPGPLRDMYDELLEAEHALAVNETAPLEIREARRIEWCLTIEALMQEIERELQDTNVVRLDRGRRRSSKSPGIK